MLRDVCINDTIAVFNCPVNILRSGIKLVESINIDSSRCIVELAYEEGVMEIAETFISWLSPHLRPVIYQYNNFSR